jgi:3-methyladenine DNA glycosylase AlkD
VKQGVRRELDEIRAELRRLGSAKVRDGTALFFKPDEPVRSYGVAAPAQKDVSRGIYQRIKRWPVADRDSLCTELWKGGSQEEGALVCYVYRRFAKQCGEREFRLFTRWLDRYVHNWAHTDGLALWLLGASIANQPALIAELDAWTESPNRWKRRAAAVCLVYSARKGVHTAAILRIAGLMLGDADDMVQKGTGWLLKETYPKQPSRVMRFLAPRRARTSRLLLRYAAEKMTAADRARVLAK